MTNGSVTKCFVIMPYGTKPMRDGSGRQYDFEKIYRVLIKRAISDAGLEAVRADERKGSSIIQTDMFKDLRDHDIVLADLSLHNANVFYELGMRHVMSARGTVLICQEGTELPFDVHLSRVVFYPYDGQCLDVEQSERVIRELSMALEEAKRGAPDSPVHALLETVLKTPELSHLFTDNGALAAEDSLARYQKQLAKYWREEGRPFEDLRKEHSHSVFGMRVLGYYCLEATEMPHEASKVASSLTGCEQHRMSTQIYERLEAVRPLSSNEWLVYGMAVSESQMDLAGSRKASVLFQRALEAASADSRAAARCCFELAELAERLWRLQEEESDLKATIASIEQARNAWYKLEEGSFSLGRAAWLHLKSMLLLRVLDDDRERPDHERNREAILQLKTAHAVDPVDAMFLRWCKALALADGGDGSGANQVAMIAMREDAKLCERPDSHEIRRGYTRLRRLIEQFSHWFSHPVLVSQVTQVFQISANGGT